jgi:hypothetical protein
MATGRPPMMNNPMQYVQALRAPAAIPHNFGVPAGGQPVPMPSGGISMPAPPRIPETYRPPIQVGGGDVRVPNMPAGGWGGVVNAAAPIVGAQPVVQGRMPIPKVAPHNYGVPNGGSPIPMPGTATRMPVNAVPPRAY